MGGVEKKPHAVCIPYPAQGHINPMLKLAKLLHYNGFHVTFVNTEYNHRRLLKSRGPTALDGLPDFRFAAIPDGLPPSVVTAQQLTEFAWGLANSKKTFLWIIRPDIVAGDSAMLPPEFLAETRERGMMVDWCPQEQVLSHSAVGGFLTHSGWNSTLESIVGGVPMTCWPFIAEQQTNCRFSCVEWEVGMEIDNDVKRDEVEVLVREMMDGDKGKKMKAKALEWKGKAEEASKPGGSSYLNLDKLIKEVLLK